MLERSNSFTPTSLAHRTMKPSQCKKVLLVFIHGFLGSDQSFQEFPVHLQSRLTNELHLPVETIHYPKYDTRGDNRIQVKQLVDWLLLNATTIQYSHVVLCAHSMGGLLAADAYRTIYDLKIPTTAPNPLVALFAGIGALFPGAVPLQTAKIEDNAATDSQVKSANDPAEPTVRELINIAGIVTFDSPLYGLHTALPLTGVNKAAAMAKGMTGTSALTASPATGTSLTPSSATIAMAVGIGAQLISSGGLFATASGMTSTVAAWAMEEARSHLEFLFPLTESRQAMDERVHLLMNEPHVHFRGIYLDVSITSISCEFVGDSCVHSLDSQNQAR